MRELQPAADLHDPVVSARRLKFAVSSSCANPVTEKDGGKPDDCDYIDRKRNNRNCINMSAPR
jgi:hypothetical protein